MLRIIDKDTNLFIRDDFAFNETTEIGLNVAPAQGFYHPKWDGTEWVEGGTKPEKQPQEPSLEERLEQTEQILQATTMAFTEFAFSQTMGKQHDDN